MRRNPDGCNLRRKRSQLQRLQYLLANSNFLSARAAGLGSQTHANRIADAFRKQNS